MDGLLLGNGSDGGSFPLTREARIPGLGPIALGVVLAWSSCACSNVTTLQTARPMAEGQQEHALQGWLLPTNDASVLSDQQPVVLPAYSYRRGAGGGEWGARLTMPGNVQFDYKLATMSPRFAVAAAPGIGTDVVSLAGAAISGDDSDSSSDASDDDDFTPYTLDLFAPVIASVEIVPEYLSLHGTLRPALWVFTPGDERNDHVRFSGIAALGLRVGKNFGFHAEGAPLWTTDHGFGWTAGVSLFVRSDSEPTAGIDP